MPRGKSGQYAGDGSSETINVAYASPIVMVMKKDSSNRVYVDFRKFNKITEVDPEPLTMAEDLFHRLPVQDQSDQRILADTGYFSVCDSRLTI